MRPSALLLLALAACNTPSGSGATPAPSASVTVAASASASAPSASATATSPGKTQSWRGSYKSAASPIAAAPNGKKAHWTDTQPTAGIGDGALTLAVDGATGHVLGTVDGPLGPGTLDGVVTDGKLAGTVRRKDPNDQGFTGTVLGSVANGHLEGTMSGSLGLAGALRTATFTLTPSSAAP
ncbi:MAG TPA: hypothetical protein VGL81_06025 [Polyangiaceae bacterium]|jgi:hypothetical protein